MVKLLIEFDKDPNFKGIEFNELNRIVKQNIRNKKLKNISDENNN